MSIHVTTLYTAMCDECEWCGRDTYREDYAMQDEREHKAENHTDGSNDAR